MKEEAKELDNIEKELNEGVDTKSSDKDKSLEQLAEKTGLKDDAKMLVNDKVPPAQKEAIRERILRNRDKAKQMSKNLKEDVEKTEKKEEQRNDLNTQLSNETNPSEKKVATTNR